MKEVLKDIPASTAALIKDLIFMKRKSRFYAERGAIACGLLKGQQHYTRLLILGTARTGSTFLRSMLNSHPNIICVGELFNDEPKISWQMPGYFQFPGHLRQYRENPQRFLDTVVYGPSPTCILASGFKIFYGHTGNPEHSDVWQYLRAGRDIRIIHLKRHNVLRTYLSLEKAFKTGQFFVRSTGLVREPVIPLDADQCRHFFTSLTAQIDLFERFFEHHRVLDLSYERLAANPEKEMDRVLAFLKVPARRLVTRTVKQARLPLHRAISNYAELKRAFSGTRWEDYFED